MSAADKMIGNNSNATAAESVDSSTIDELFAPVPARPIPPSPFSGGEKKARVKDRKAYLLQPQSNAVMEGWGLPGQYYIESDPNNIDENGDRVVTQGRSTKILELTVIDWGKEQAFNRGTQPICYSPDGQTGHPTDAGKAAPYNIVDGQACQTCPWLKKFTAPDVDKNGYCSRINTVFGVTEDENGQPAKVKLSFKNTAAKVGDQVHQMFPKHTEQTADGPVYKPFKVRFTSTKDKGKAYFSPAAEEVK